MHSHAKDWLVRTRSREILGPYSQSELYSALAAAEFSAEDEISPPAGPWISAQTLLNRDPEEVTRTSARNQTASINLNSAEHTPTPTSSLPSPDDLTPTGPELFSESLDRKPETYSPRASVPSHSPRVTPLLTGILLLVVLFLFLNLRTQHQRTVDVRSVANRPEGETPLVRRAYSLIHRGKTREAMNELMQFHETNPKDLEYLIPYAITLILEDESASRARKLLEQVLAHSPSPLLKAKAHLWIGYLMLAEDEGDFGESHFLEALQLNPKDPTCRFNLGRAYLKQEKFGQALDYLQLAELEMPDLWLIHIYKGRTKVALGHMEEARASFRLAIESAPDRWLTYIYYSLFLAANRDFNEARLTIRKMLTRDPHFEVLTPPPLGYFQERVDYREYLTVFAQVMSQAGSEEKEVGRLYIGFLLNGAKGSEGKRLETMAERGGLLTRVIGLKATIDRSPTADELRKALTRVSGSLADFGPYGYVIRGDAKMRLGLLPDAQIDFQQALLADPRSSSAHWMQYSLYGKTGKPEEAAKEIQTILSYHPHFIPAIVQAQSE